MISTKISSQCEDEGQIVCDNEAAYTCRLLPTGFYTTRYLSGDDVCKNAEQPLPASKDTITSTTTPIETKAISACTAAKYESCLAKKEILWTPFILKNEWQKQQGYSGGEGMQMVWDIDWNAADPAVLYLTVDTMGIWKSADGGFSWNRLSLDIPLQGAIAVASDPQNSDIVLAGFSGNVAAGNYETDDDGVYKSSDGGSSWKKVASPYAFTRTKHGKIMYFDTATFDGTKTTTIYVGTPEGLIVSTDAGETWSNAGLSQYEVYGIEDGPSNTLYVATNAGLFSYARATQISTQIGTTLPSFPKDIAVHPTDKNIVYAGVSGGVYKSEDSGKTFTAKTNGMQIKNSAGTALEYPILAVSQQDPTQMYAYPHMMGGNVPYYSNNAGETWQALSGDTEHSLYYGAYYAEPIAFNPSNSNEAITERGGGIIFKLNKGVTEYSGEGYHGASLRDIDFIDEQRQLFCIADYGIFLTEDAGESFTNLNVLKKNGANNCNGVDSYNDIIVAASGEWYSLNIVRSTDFGATWETVQEASSTFEFVRFNPDSPNVVYADEYVSTDYGETWQNVADNYQILAIDPKDSSTVYGIADIGESLKVGKSTNNGKSWQQIGADIPTPKFYDVAIDPFSDTLHLLVAVGFYGIYEYKDGAWSLRGGGKTAANYGLFWTTANYYFVEFDPLIKDVAWTGQYGYGKKGEGVFISFDGGTNWQNVIPNNSKYNEAIDININPRDDTIYLTVPGIITVSLPELCECSVE
jgi:photosystem II stability/assembly factor-like uncharacterized protein